MTDYTNEYSNDPMASMFRPQQVKMLAEGGISPTAAYERGVISLRIAKEQLKANWPQLAWAAQDDADSGLIFEHTILNGARPAPTRLPQYRPDADSPTMLDNPEAPKYVFPKGSGTNLSVGLNAQKRLADGTARRIVLVEGTKQSIAADIWAPEDTAVIGMFGIMGWKVDDRLNAALVEFCGAANRALPITVIPDADVHTNGQVFKAATWLWEELKGIRATATLGRIPAVAGAKTGLDDYLGSIPAAERTAALANLIRTATPTLDKAVEADEDDADDAFLPDVRPTILLKKVSLNEAIAFGVQAAASATRNGEPFVFRKVASDGKATALVTVAPDGTSSLWTEANAHKLWFTILQPAEREFHNAVTGQKEYDYSTSFPRDVAAALFNAALYAESIPAVRIMATEPVILPNGNVVSKPGYNGANRVLVTIPRGQRAAWRRYSVTEKPTTADAQAALDYLNTEILSDVPFAEDADRAIVLTYFVTAATRHLYGTAPGFAFDAPERGSGKSLIAACGRIIRQGNGGYQSVGHRRGQDAETWKQLGTLAIAGGSHAHIDELPREEKLTSTALSELLTAPVVKTRLLGQNAEIAVEGLMLTICGNNVQVGLDFVRRILKARLHYTGTGTAARRTGFRHDNLLRWVTENRPELLAAIHTIVRYGIQNDMRPNGRLGSYEDWSSIVLGSLTAVTIGDAAVSDLVLDAQQEAADTEDELADDWAELHRFIHTEMPEGWHKTVDIVRAYRETNDAAKPNLPVSLNEFFGNESNVARGWSKVMATVKDTPMVDGTDRFALRRKKIGNGVYFRVENLAN
ncbi:hypothetical protein [Microbacterium hydrocarbonoxydans]|uniref:hypothetical protein n=1 Tax=Microbacterium hydrocarbonoxydans TaxID=273678 RepID=UPI003D96C03A